GGVGMDFDVSAVPLREHGMDPVEVMTSESQERMLAIVEPKDLDEVLAICERWEVRATVVGKVTDGDALRIVDGFDGPVLGDVPASALHDAAPKYDRPRAAPADLAERQADDPRALPAPDDAGADVVSMLADTAWVSSQYDHQLFLNTVVAPGGDASVLRLKHPTTGIDTGRGLALSTDGNHRWCAVDPRVGTS
ncbi:phosphoribosylformylglycinamidine synthase II, partial [cyanobacterium TDX16]